jgi:YD repeat-containing protein
MPDGRRDVYTPDGQGGYTRPHEVHNDLVKIADNHYEVRFPDGRVYEYDIPAGTGSQQPFMIEMRDVYGQALTIGYNVNVELETVTDASGKVTTLIYNANGLVEQVDDPFERSAYFEYDANNNLTKITDMGGIWTELAYDADSYVTMVKNSKGQWGFYIEPADGVAGYPDDYPPPGAITWEIHRITVTNPEGGKEEFFYHSGCGWAIGVDECAYSWYVSPRDYVPYASQLENNFRSARKTLYFYDIVSGRGEIRKITYPEGGYIEYKNFDPLTGKATLIDEYHGGVTHSTQRSYNTNGRKNDIRVLR